MSKFSINVTNHWKFVEFVFFLLSLNDFDLFEMVELGRRRKRRNEKNKVISFVLSLRKQFSPTAGTRIFQQCAFIMDISTIERYVSNTEMPEDACVLVRRYRIDAISIWNSQPSSQMEIYRQSKCVCVCEFFSFHLTGLYCNLRYTTDYVRWCGIWCVKQTIRLNL